MRLLRRFFVFDILIFGVTIDLMVKKRLKYFGVISGYSWRLLFFSIVALLFCLVRIHHFEKIFCIVRGQWLGSVNIQTIPKTIDDNEHTAHMCIDNERTRSSLMYSKRDYRANSERALSHKPIDRKRKRWEPLLNIVPYFNVYTLTLRLFICISDAAADDVARVMLFPLFSPDFYSSSFYNSGLLFIMYFIASEWYLFAFSYWIVTETR